MKLVTTLQVVLCLAAVGYYTLSRLIMFPYSLKVLPLLCTVNLVVSLFAWALVRLRQGKKSEKHKED